MKSSTTIVKGSTILLRVAAGIISLGILALCVFLLPQVWIHAYDEYPAYGHAVRAVIAALYISTIPFYIGIYRGWQILIAIDHGRAFTNRSVAALQTIAYCAGGISLIYILSLPFFYTWADNDDAPGLMVIGLFLVCMPLIVSVAVELLRRLLVEAVNIKSENDLTV